MTAGDIPVHDSSHPAYADYSSLQFSAVYIDSSGYARKATTATAVMGILQDKPSAQGMVCAVRELGHTKARMLTHSGAIGDPLCVGDANGRLTTGTVGTDVICAIALEAWTTTDQIIEVALTTRTAQGISSRAGQLVFNIPLAQMTTTGAVYAAMPLGFAGTITDMYAIVTKVSASSSGSTAITLKIGSTPVTSLTMPLLYSSLTPVGTVIASGAAATAANTFVAANTLTIYSTSTTTFAGDTGAVELHVITT